MKYWLWQQKGKYWIGRMYSEECCVHSDYEKQGWSLLSEPEENPASWSLRLSGSDLTAQSGRDLGGQSTGSPGGEMKNKNTHENVMMMSNKAAPLIKCNIQKAAILWWRLNVWHNSIIMKYCGAAGMLWPTNLVLQMYAVLTPTHVTTSQLFNFTVKVQMY